MGKNCVQEVLQHDPDRIVQIYTAKPGPFEGRVVSNKELFRMVESESHQGVVAEVKPRSFGNLKSLLDRDEDGVILMLDSIFDPQNLGACIRSAECFGVLAVVWSKNRGADLSPTVSKASAGASELVELIKVSNLVEAAKQCKEAGFEAVAASVDTGAIPIKEHRPSKKTLIVMGSEGKGVQPLLLKQMDQTLYIPMKGKIDSLNVAQATAVFLSAVS